MASGIFGSVVVLVWMALNLDEVMAALKAGPPAETVPALLAGHGDLTMLVSAVAAVPTFGAVVFCRRLLDKKPVLELGLAWRPGQLAAGLASGALATLALVGALIAAGRLRVDGLAPEVGPLHLARLLGLLALTFLQSGAEELVCRGYLMRTLMGYFRPWVAVVGVSVFFGLLHLANPGTSPLSFVSTALIGLLFSQVTLRTNSLWAAIGLHTAWNFTLGAVASLPVSGMRMSHLLVVSDVGEPWLTGGAYGLEAGVVTVAVVAVACVALAVRRAPAPTGEPQPAPVVRAP